MYDSIIIGAGPAGLTAALYLKRANKNILILEKEAPGGKLLSLGKIENYPGFPSIEGADLAIKMYDQVKSLKVPFKFMEVLEIKKDQHFLVITKEEIFETKTVIYATGNQNKKPKIDNFQKYENLGISYCATCDGSLYKNEEVSVLGSSEKALEEALYLANLCKKVTIITEDDHFESVFLFDKIKEQQKIKIYLNTKIVKINGENKLESVRLENKLTKENFTLPLKALFVYLGDAPSTYPLRKLAVLNEKGNLEVNQDLETAVLGLFGAGDCLNKKLRQIATATGDGALAAISALKRM